MGNETKPELINPDDKIESAWRKLAASEQYETYNDMGNTAVEEVKKKIREGNPPEEGMEDIYKYLRAVEEYRSL